MRSGAASESTAVDLETRFWPKLLSKRGHIDPVKQHRSDGGSFMEEPCFMIRAPSRLSVALVGDVIFAH